MYWKRIRVRLDVSHGHHLALEAVGRKRQAIGLQRRQAVENIFASELLIRLARQVIDLLKDPRADGWICHAQQRSGRQLFPLLGKRHLGLGQHVIRNQRDAFGG